MLFVEGVWLVVAEVGTEKNIFNSHFLVEYKVITLDVDAADDPSFQMVFLFPLMFFRFF